MIASVASMRSVASFLSRASRSLAIASLVDRLELSCRCLGMARPGSAERNLIQETADFNRAELQNSSWSTAQGLSQMGMCSNDSNVRCLHDSCRLFKSR